MIFLATNNNLLLTSLLIALVVGALAWAGLIWFAMRRRGMHLWIGTYVTESRRRADPAPNQDVHLLLCIGDHYEPHRAGADDERAMARVQAWLNEYPRQFSAFRDSDGRPPRHTFFYPLEEHADAEMYAISDLCKQGFGEVEIHLHHDHDTSENLRTRLLDYKQKLANQFGMLSRRRSDNALAYGFIHGNWALDNSRPDGRWCGVNDELNVLRETGCYADFTMPSAPSLTQTRKINSIYYAVDDPHRPKSHDWGVDVGAAPRPGDSLLMVQGPLLLNWQSRSMGILPRVENGCLQHNQAPSLARLDLWLRARIQVPSRPDWYFVKLYSHGAPEDNAHVMLGPPMVNFHAALAQRARQNPGFHYHYVTARETYNLIRAAEDGWAGTVADALDYELVWNGAASVVSGGKVVADPRRS